MTNKLPELGRIYQRRDDATHKVLVTGISFTATGNRALVSYGHETDYSDYFMKDFEELPEDKAEIKPETQSHISELSPEVKEAMEELDKELDCWMPTEDKEEYKLTSKAERLLNALDKQFKVSEATKETVNLKKEDEMQVSYKVLKTGEFEGRPPLDQLIREDKVKVSDVEKAKERLKKSIFLSETTIYPSSAPEIFTNLLVNVKTEAKALLDALEAENK